MKWIAIAVLAIAATSPRGAGADRPVPFRVGETLIYDVSWSSYVTAGTAVMTVKEKKPSPNATAYSIVAEGRPTPLVSRIYNLYYKLETLLDSATLLPQRGSIYSEEGRRQRTRTTEFTRAENQGRQDSLSAIYALRAMTFKAGDRIAMGVTDADKRYQVQFEVGRPERVSTPMGGVNAWPLKTSVVDAKGDPAARNVAIWLSTDARRLPVKIQAELPIGSFDVILREVR